MNMNEDDKERLKRDLLNLAFVLIFTLGFLALFMGLFVLIEEVYLVESN